MRTPLTSLAVLAPLAVMTPLALVACQLGCSSVEPAPPAAPRTLAPYNNPFSATASQWSPQPIREKPQEIVVSPDGQVAYVSLPGVPDDPGHHVVVVDLKNRAVRTRIEVGAGPTGLALHPSGRHLLVLNRYSNFASIIDTHTHTVVAQPAIDFYAVEAAFTPDGHSVFITNRWRDAVAVWTVESTPERFTVLHRTEPGIPVGSNPRDLALSPDGRTLAVAALTGLTVSLIDVATRTERHRISVGAPPNGLTFVGQHLFVATTSASTHHLPLEGPDTDGDGHAGDGTPNVNFQDLQNDIAVYDSQTGNPTARYTSDTICCKDFRDVGPTDLARHGDLLPPADTWIIGGALPEQITGDPSADPPALYVTYSGSNQAQRFTVDPSGALTAGPIWATTGHNPHAIALAGDTLLITHRLSETLGIYDRASGQPLADIEIGNLRRGPYPATDAEIGELFNFVTASYTVDGDQTCAHCHREGSNIDKAFSMPLTRYGGLGSRMTMAYRGAADTRPWFFESSMDQTNFKPVINEFARIENFCCTDYTLWPDGTSPRCADSPPDACSTQPNPSSVNGFSADRGGERTPFEAPRPTPFASRDAFYMAASQRLLGRTASFGDGLFFEDPLSGDQRPIRLNFDGMTRALGLFLMTAPRLLPNPNPGGTAAARRGRALFESPETGCATCHPAPAFTVSTDHNPFNVPIRMPPVISPVRASDGTNLDLFAGGFMATFPQTQMDTCGAVCGAPACAEDPDICDEYRSVRLGAPSLRGLWDRADHLLHDGRANGLREALCTPAHPALRPGETGYNERGGIIDTHGGTSHLSPGDIADLIAYILSL